MKKALSYILSFVILLSIITSACFSAQASYVDEQFQISTSGVKQERCTYRVWHEAYNRLEISLPTTWGNGGSWATNAKNDGYNVDNTPTANSIACWSDNGGWGHVAYVTDVDSTYIYIIEAGINPSNSYPNYWYRETNYSINNQNRWNGYRLEGYIHLRCLTHKWNSGKVTTQPTCKKDGVKTYTCTVCGENKTETIKHSSKYHNYRVSKCIKSTLHTNGKLIKKCTHCGKTVKSTIYRPKTIKLKKTKFVYDGKKKKPEVVIKNTKGKEISSKYYNVTFTGNKKVGKAAAKISFKTRYSGAVTRNFVIIPKGTSLSKLKAGSKSFTAKWKKQTSQTTGYQLQYATNSKFTKDKKTVTIKSAKTASKKIKKLKAGKKYYVRVRTYKVRIYKKNKKVLFPSAWSKSLTVKTKKAADAKSVLLKKIKTNLEITKVFYSDYDGDGKKELFAVCGDIGNDISSFGEREIWFVSTKQTKCDNLSTMIYSAKCVKVNSKQKMFIAETGAGGSGSSSIWYYVKASKRKGNTFPFSGLTQIKKNQFKVTLHDFDNYVSDTGKPMGGHTYRQYYFKWTGTKFLEYKGTLISQKQLKKYKNGASIINKIKKLGYSIDTIYKRKNGVININVHIATNYEHELRYENVNLKLSNNKVSVIVTYKGGKDIVGKSSFGGIYKANLVFY